MSKHLTPKMLSSMIRLAHSLPKGSDERKAILSDLATKLAQDDIKVGFRVVVPNKYTTYGTYSNIGDVERIYDNDLTLVRLPPLGNGRPGYHGYSEVLVPMKELKRAPKRV